MAFELKENLTRAEKVTAFANSELFERIFSDGMDLVEETAHYLDGEGRHESKLLDRNSALAYASESMRLTTRLMQAASWLLVQRAVKEGEMHAKDVMDEKYRLGAKAICATTTKNSYSLPHRLSELLERSASLYTRIERLDNAMFTEDEEVIIANPVNEQMARLQAAFGGIGIN